MKRSHEDDDIDLDFEHISKVVRAVDNALIYEHLKQHNSGVLVTPDDGVSIEQQNQHSIFEVLTLSENKKNRIDRIKKPTKEKLLWYCVQVDSRHFDVLKESRDLPDESSLCELERLFNVHFNVYILELFNGTFHRNLFRVKESDKCINVVYLSGRFLYIEDLDKFIPRPSNVNDKPRLKWIKAHRHILTLTKDTTRYQYTDTLNFYRCLAAHYRGKNISQTAQRLEIKYEDSLVDDRKKVIGDVTYRNHRGAFTPQNIYGEIESLEKVFSIRINVYRLGACDHNAQQVEDYPEAKVCPSVVRLSANDQFTDVIHLLAYEDRFYYITDINRLSQHIVCNKCNKALDNKHYNTHFKRCRGAQTNVVFNRKTYSVVRTLAEELALRGIELSPELQFPEAVLTWDIETYTPGSKDECSTCSDKGVPFSITRQDVEVVTSENDDQSVDDVLNADALIELLEENELGIEKQKHVHKTNTLTETSNTQWSAPHTLLSIGCASNVDGYKKAKVFITQGDSQKLVEEFMDYVGEVQLAAGKQIAPLVRSTVQQILRLEKKESEELWKQLDETFYDRQKERVKATSSVEVRVDDDDDDLSLDIDIDGSDDEIDLEFHPLDFDEDGENVERDRDECKKVIGVHTPSRSTRSVSSLVGKLITQSRQLTVVGFNSGSFDTNVIGNHLLPYFNNSHTARKECASNDDILHELFFPKKKKKKGDDCNDGDTGWDKRSERPSIIKKGSKYLQLSNARFKFLDIINFCPPGVSLDSYLKGYKIKNGKLPFPYDFVTSLKLLDYPKLPSKEAFYNSLKQSHITDEAYETAQNLWKDREMKTFKDYLIAYNAADCEPFIEAIQKQKACFREKGLHLFDYVSIPGLTEKLLHKNAPSGTWFSSISKKDADLYEQFNRALQGGPSIIFHRYCVAGESVIRPKEDLGIPGPHPTVQKIIGLGELKTVYQLLLSIIIIINLSILKICLFFLFF